MAFPIGCSPLSSEATNSATAPLMPTGAVAPGDVGIELTRPPVSPRISALGEVSPKWFIF
jgi:hypothetical protein